ncbi:MAG: tripartite tricarboxylate transporter substrate binding protein [Acetobacteraceae bacterium]|nr:tripartite tricarboxylate transporter substrate binding protein [Acetobacteraceae bacterium]
MGRIGRRAALLGGAAAPLLSGGGGPPRPAAAQELSARQIRVVVGFAAGGANDIMARLIAGKLNERLQGASFVVENRPGAATLVAAEHVARAAPDGTTLLYASLSTLIAPLVNRGSALDPPRDFAAVAMAQTSPLLLVSRPDFPARTLAQVIALAKERSGRVTVSHPGSGGINHLSMAMLTKQTGAEFTLVPYNGNHPSLTALVRGDVDLASDSPFAARSLLEQGAIRAVATTGAQRSPVMPDVPAFAETVPGYEVMFWGGLLAPRGTPEPILDRLNREVDAVLRLPDVAERVRSFGAEPVGGSRADYARVIAADWARWGTVVRETGARGD